MCRQCPEYVGCASFTSASFTSAASEYFAFTMIHNMLEESLKTHEFGLKGQFNLNKYIA